MGFSFSCIFLSVIPAAGQIRSSAWLLSLVIDLPDPRQWLHFSFRGASHSRPRGWSSTDFDDGGTKGFFMQDANCDNIPLLPTGFLFHLGSVSLSSTLEIWLKSAGLWVKTSAGLKLALLPTVSTCSLRITHCRLK